MKGLDLSKEYYLKYKEDLFKEIGDLKNYLAFGLVGSGSECYGFDDEISQDHDFEPGFCIFAPANMDRKDLFKVERAYQKLPRDFMGYKRSLVENGKHGLILIEDFYKTKIATLNYESIGLDWFNVPQHFLSEATNGVIFDDYFNQFSNIRNKIKYYPEDIRLKKLAGSLLLMKQAGVYNYPRCIEHKDTASAQMAIYEYVKSTIDVIFLLNKIYKPYYKWQFRYLNKLNILSNLVSPLEYLMETDNSKDMFNGKVEIINDINEMILDEVKKQGLSKELCSDLENNAFSVNNQIKDNEIRNLDILYGV